MSDYVEGPTMTLEQLQELTKDLIKLEEQARERIAVYDAQQMIADASAYARTVRADADAQASAVLAAAQAQSADLIAEAQAAVTQWYAEASGAVAAFQAQCAADVAAAWQGRAHALQQWQAYIAAFDAERATLEDILTRPDGPVAVPAPPALTPAVVPAPPDAVRPAAPPAAEVPGPSLSAAPSPERPAPPRVAAPPVTPDDTLPPVTATTAAEPDWVFAPGPASGNTPVPPLGVAVPEQRPLTMDVAVPRLQEDPLGRVRHVG